MTERGPSLDRGSKGGKTFALKMIEWADPDSLEDEATRRQRNQLEATLVAAMRALANDSKLTVKFGAGGPRLNNRDCTLPQPGATPQQWAAARGQADGLALSLRYRDEAAEERWRPDKTAGAAFELLQACRSDALGALRFAGIATNLDAALSADLARQGADRHTQPNLLPVRLILIATLRAGFGVKLSAAGPEQIAPWRRWLDHQAPEALAGLARSLHDADAYARSASVLAPILSRLLSAGLSATPVEQPSSKPAKNTQQRAKAIENLQETGVHATDRPTTTRPDHTSPDDIGGVDGSPYRIFTDRYDQVVHASDLAPASELERLYTKLQADMKVQRSAITRLASRLQRIILAQQRRHWQFDQEDGLLDTARLDRVVANPGTALSFKVDQDGAFLDTAVTLLIDNSGSMRGGSIEMAATAADIIAQALERCGVTIEILGFTTTDWRGGRPAVDWRQRGRPPSPGRLNALNHIIYKRADQPGRRQRYLLAATQLPSLLKENIDGEALLWASRRLASRPEQRRILMVISDGAPNDAATIEANGSDYLDRHLRSVISDIENRQNLELCAIGIGHAVDRYYRQAIRLNDVSDLARAMVDQLGGLFRAGISRV